MAPQTITLSRQHLVNLRRRAQSSPEGIAQNAVPTIDRILARTRGATAGVQGDEMLDLVLLEWVFARRN